jgi:hypothetical protein
MPQSHTGRFLAKTLAATAAPAAPARKRRTA